MALSVEEVAYYVAGLAFAEDWKKTQKQFLDLGWFKGRKKELQDELLVFLYFVGDLGIFGANLENKLIDQRIRSAHQRLWEVFAQKISNTVMQKKNTRFKEYLSALENKDALESKSLRVISFAEVLGRQFTKCCCAEGIDVMLFAGEFCHLKMMAISKYIKQMDNEYGIE